MKCEHCGMESRWNDAFRAAPKSCSRRTKLLCPLCWEKRNDKAYKTFFWGPLLIVVPGVFFSIVFPNLTLGALFLSLFAIQVFSLFSTAFHELGHAVAAKLVGWRNFLIEVGNGRVVYEFRLWGSRWQFRAVPVASGCAYVGTLETPWYRLKHSVIFSGGPLANALLIVVALALSPAEDVLNGTVFDHFSPTKMLLLVNAVMLIWSLWPREFRTQYGKGHSDGLGLWKAWSRPKSEIPEIPWNYYYMEGHELRHARHYSQAQHRVEEGLRRFPGNCYLEILAAAVQFDLKDYAAARTSYLRLMERFGESEEMRATFLNNVACADLRLRDSNLLEEADNNSRIALEKAPSSAHFKGTRGCVFIERGSLDEGTKLLLEVLREHREKTDKAACACYIGVAERLRGNVPESKRFFDLARALDPQCVLLDRELK